MCKFNFRLWKHKLRRRTPLYFLQIKGGSFFIVLRIRIAIECKARKSPRKINKSTHFSWQLHTLLLRWDEDEVRDPLLKSYRDRRESEDDHYKKRLQIFSWWICMKSWKYTGCFSNVLCSIRRQTHSHFPFFPSRWWQCALVRPLMTHTHTSLGSIFTTYNLYFDCKLCPNPWQYANPTLKYFFNELSPNCRTDKDSMFAVRIPESCWKIHYNMPKVQCISSIQTCIKI